MSTEDQPPTPPPDLSGRKFGNFELIRRLGEGAMAEVYLAEQTNLARNVAVKVLKAVLAEDETYLKRFYLEAQAAASLIHANIVQIYEVANHLGYHFIAQEYVEGQDLREVIHANGAFAVRKGLSIMCQVAAALAKADSEGVIHRDIKPENIMLKDSGEAKVADFGLARMTREDKESELTQEGISMGTPLYMSPEQIRGQELDPRSDIYSFGVTCYHMLAGRPPFIADTAFEVAMKHCDEEPKPLQSLKPDLPPELCRIVHRTLAKERESRHGSSMELLRELRKLYDEIRQNPPTPGPSTPPESSKAAPTIATPPIAMPPVADTPKADIPDEKTPDEEAPDDSVIEFRCWRCQVDLSAPKIDVGSKLLCPQCQTECEVPKRSTRVPSDDYAFAAPAGSPATHLPSKDASRPGGDSASAFVRLSCPGCDAQFETPARLIGSQFSCPDCGGKVPVVVSDPAASKQPTAQPKYYPIHCSLCDTLMHGTEDQVGESLVCPDCHTATVFQMPKKIERLDSSHFRVARDEEYENAGANVTEPVEPRAGIDYRTGRSKYEDEVDEAKGARCPKPPERPLTVGVFGFPVQSGMWWRTLLLIVVALPVVFLIFQAWYYAGLAEDGVHEFRNDVYGLLCNIGALLGIAVWGILIGAHQYVIVNDMSHGSDHITDWPKVFLEWIHHGLAVLVAVAISAAPGATISVGLHILTVPPWYAQIFTVLSLWFGFPYVLLSILKEDSMTNPISPAIWELVSPAQRWWVKFYGLTMGLFLVAAIILLAGAGIGSFLVRASSALKFPLQLAGAALVAALAVCYILTYSRLLGRLAWVSAAEAYGVIDEAAGNSPPPESTT